MWQPIETALKDGTEIDLWIAECVLPNGYVDKAHRVASCRWSSWDDRWEAKFVEVSSYVSLDSFDDGIPTHWMPLPEPPA